MNISWLTAPAAQAVAWALLHLLWQGAIVAAVLWATLALMTRRSANTRYAVSCLALATILVLGVATALRGELESRGYRPLEDAGSYVFHVRSLSPLPDPERPEVKWP